MPNKEHIREDLEKLQHRFSGELATDKSTRILYATDASAYRQLPQAVAWPKNSFDIVELVEFAKLHNTSLIPRTAGTSLAGQVVGGGIVVDVGKFMNHILEINPEEKWVRVEPGVVLDELNQALHPHGLFFSPETATSNRCMIGGMVGNNSCGAHSLVYGSTRDHLLSVKAVLSDSSEVVFNALSREAFETKCAQHTLEGKLYRRMQSYLSNPENRKEIREHYPDPSIRRRNTGYALDLLIDTEPFDPKGEKFNFSKLLAGSEGTLAFFTEFTLSLDPLPPPVKALVCVHCDSLEDALHGNLIALKHDPVAVELMDDTILQLSKRNIEQQNNRFFISGDPAALLVIEFAADTINQIHQRTAALEKAMKAGGIGTHFPVITGKDMDRVWGLRNASLGLLANMPGDAKTVAVVEDTAVKVDQLPAYIGEFKELLRKYKLQAAFNAHIGTGELHIRPVLNLKDQRDTEIFRELAVESARLVKKYNGSLSGEHGDGRLRGEFIPIILGEKNFALLREIKRTWDPENIFNQGKIFETPPMHTSLRYTAGQETPEVDTVLDFSEDQGYIRSVEKCNGSGDCRKSERMGGTMCPSYQATGDEKSTTRARANILREMITHSERSNRFDHPEIRRILDLCLSCKGCKSECPSNVDMAKLKAEFLHQYYKSNKMPFSDKAMAHFSENYQFASVFPLISNFIIKNDVGGSLLRKILKIAPERSLPALHSYTLRAWIKKNQSLLTPAGAANGKVCLFIDEFTNLTDTTLGVETVQLLSSLGYEVLVVNHPQSGRAYLSKGMLSKARHLAQKNIDCFRDVINEYCPLIGIEPGALLVFRDEYPDLLRGEDKAAARNIAKNTLLVEEFIVQEFKKGKIRAESFSETKLHLRVHGHCHQKALGSVQDTVDAVSIPTNYSAEEIPSGCCGMAGTFGYEETHYDLSMKIGELVLFPEVRKTGMDQVIVASGSSCRHQIKDGTERQALHPVTVLYNALKKIHANAS